MYNYLKKKRKKEKKKKIAEHSATNSNVPFSRTGQWRVSKRDGQRAEWTKEEEAGLEKANGRQRTTELLGVAVSRQTIVKGARSLSRWTEESFVTAPRRAAESCLTV